MRAAAPAEAVLSSASGHGRRDASGVGLMRSLIYLLTLLRFGPCVIKNQIKYYTMGMACACITSTAGPPWRSHAAAVTRCRIACRRASASASLS